MEEQEGPSIEGIFDCDKTVDVPARKKLEKKSIDNHRGKVEGNN